VGRVSEPAPVVDAATACIPPLVTTPGGSLGNLPLDIRQAFAPGTSFRGALLQGLVARGADLRCADFSDADLADADFRGSILSDASVRGACLDRARFSGAVISATNLGALPFQPAIWHEYVGVGGDTFPVATFDGASTDDAEIFGVKQ
jgi:uncharacterized protein YjbI with pentapeptide repeats